MAVNINEVLTKLFKTIEKPKTVAKVAQKGAIITFRYIGQAGRSIHDPYPMVIITDIFIDMIRGVNLHYLPLQQVMRTMQDNNMAGNVNMSFRNVSANSLVYAFRSYKKSGISNQKLLDIDYLKNLLTVSQALNIGEMEMIRKQIRDIMDQENRQPQAVPGEQQWQ